MNLPDSKQAVCLSLVLKDDNDDADVDSQHVCMTVLYTLQSI